MRFVDPDGMMAKDIGIRGDAKYQQKVLADLQKMTTDKLGIVNGRVVVVGGGANEGKTYTTGTNMVRTLIESEHLVEIRPTMGDNSASPLGNGAYGNEANPGAGSSTSIEYNTNSKGDKIVNADGTTGRPPFIGLGHELGHALLNALGLHDTTPTTKTDPDSGQTGVLDQDEVNVRQIDNEIRDEHLGEVDKEQEVKLRQEPQ